MSWNPAPDEVADRYASARSRVVTMVGPLTNEEASTPVPGTPRWDVRELVSHLAGGATDMVTGNVEGAGGDRWTAAQVEARRDRSMAELLDEWDGVAGRLESGLRAGSLPVPMAFDVITHEQDLRGALGAEPIPDPEAYRFVIDGFCARLDRVVPRAGLAALQLIDTGGTWCRGTPGGVQARAPEFEWFRALTGRRSGSQVARFEWSDDALPYLDLLSPFGPLRTSDVSDVAG
jgi:uncharacterized protein (TIGR03083 family)